MLTTNLATGRLLELIDRTIADLETIRRHLPAAMQRLDDAEPGYPGGQSTTSSTAISTDDGPLRSAIILNDNALKDAADLRKHLGRLTTDARNTLAIAQRWGIERRGDGTQREPDEIWCRSCLRIGHMAPKREGKHGPNCRWCADTLTVINSVRADQRRAALTALPLEALRHHAAGKRTTARDIEQWARDAGRK